MSEIKLPLGKNTFAQGVLRYRDTYPTEPGQRRIVVPVQFGDLSPTPAILDTGAPWCILGPEEAEGIGFDFRSQYELEERMRIRGDRWNGWLCRVQIVLNADVGGESIEVESQVFIPDSASKPWDLPNFIGVKGLLELIRFAVDPETNLFYFGVSGDPY